MDVSADLMELSRTPVVVISAGIKSILDIPRTLEVLETFAVPTVAYQTNEFPCFFSPNSRIKSPARVDNAAQVASAYWAARALNLAHGMLVAVPPPDPAGETIEVAIQDALKEAEMQGIQGQAVTPFILKRVAESTGGDSLRCNISLVQNNAKVGSDIAMAVAKQKNATAVGVVPSSQELPRPSRVVVLGGTVLDIVAKPKAKLLLGTSNPSDCAESDGGVARNVAEVLGRLGSKPLLYSAVGDDARGQALKQRQEDYGIQDSNLTICTVESFNTATFLAVLEGATSDLHTACADMAVMSEIQVPPREVLEQAEMLVFDANPPVTILREAAQIASDLGLDVFFEPTSVPKTKLVAQDPALMRCLTGAFPNLDELIAIRDAACQMDIADEDGRLLGEIDVDLAHVQTVASQVLDCMSPTEAYLVITMGVNGVMFASRINEHSTGQVLFEFKHFPVSEEVDVQNSTGAGDSLCGAFLHACLQGKNYSDAIALGMRAASLSLRSPERTVAPELNCLASGTDI
jgi:pseudouridine-5'-phosphate glycosidase/pseudouridine kinase